MACLSFIVGEELKTTVDSELEVSPEALLSYMRSRGSRALHPKCRSRRGPVKVRTRDMAGNFGSRCSGGLSEPGKLALTNQLISDGRALVRLNEVLDRKL